MLYNKIVVLIIYIKIKIIVIHILDNVLKYYSHSFHYGYSARTYVQSLSIIGYTNNIP